MQTITGGCLCGALRYEATTEPAYAGYCCCSDCRKASGSGFVGFMGFPASAISFTGESRVHELRPQCKLAATVLFILAVVVTPREAFWAFGAYAVLLAGVALAGRVPLRTLMSRLRFEAPFVAFAFFLPLIGQGRRIDVLGVSLSVAGLWGAWNIIVKGTIGLVGF